MGKSKDSLYLAQILSKSSGGGHIWKDIIGPIILGVLHYVIMSFIMSTYHNCPQMGHQSLSLLKTCSVIMTLLDSVRRYHPKKDSYMPRLRWPSPPSYEFLIYQDSFLSTPLCSVSLIDSFIHLFSPYLGWSLPVYELKFWKYLST
jgi:hypothetical protein